MAKQGRKVGSRVKLTAFGCKLHPDLAGLTGKVTRREVLTRGHGLSPAYHSYRISYFVRFSGKTRDYLMDSRLLTKV